MLKSPLDQLTLQDEDLAIAPVSLAEQAAERLRELILLEKLAPGQRLSERELSERLNISRTPLREAIRIVASEGLIDMQRNRQPRVANPTLEHLQNLFDVQASMEALAGRLFIQRATDEQLAQVQALHERLQEFERGAHPMEFFRLDMEFHRAIVLAAGNSVLAETHKQYNAALFRARFLSSREACWQPATIAGHAEIVDALTKKDPVRASDVLISHLETCKDNVATLMEGAQRPTRKRQTESAAVAARSASQPS